MSQAACVPLGHALRTRSLRARQDPGGGTGRCAARSEHPDPGPCAPPRERPEPHPALPSRHGGRVPGPRVLLGRRAVLLADPGRGGHRRRLPGRHDPEPHLRGGVLGSHRPRRGRPGRLRPGRPALRGATPGLLGVPRPHPGHAAGQRRRHPVPLRHLHHLRRAGGAGAGQPGPVPGRAAGRGVRRDHHRDRPCRPLPLRRGVPPAVPLEEPGRLLRPRRHWRGVPERGVSRHDAVGAEGLEPPTSDL
jgi:hypothetical protein